MATSKTLTAPQAHILNFLDVHAGFWRLRDIMSDTGRHFTSGASAIWHLRTHRWVVREQKRRVTDPNRYAITDRGRTILAQGVARSAVNPDLEGGLTITDLITQLQRVRAEQGDLRVVTPGHSVSRFNDVEVARPRWISVRAAASGVAKHRETPARTAGAQKCLVLDFKGKRT